MRIDSMISEKTKEEFFIRLARTRRSVWSCSLNEFLGAGCCCRNMSGIGREGEVSAGHRCCGYAHDVICLDGQTDDG
jgi:hypothetical protein